MCTTGPYIGVKLWNLGAKRVPELKTDVEYTPKHGYRNHNKNKIRMASIYYDKRGAQGKEGQDPKCQSLQ